jgi:hypothetical protein
MTEHKAPHRAKPEVWAAVERWGKNDLDTLNCFLELRSRVEALEAAAKPAESNYPEKPDSSLVYQISGVIAETFAPYVTADKPARAAILAVADWFDQQNYHGTAARLRMEAK